MINWARFFSEGYLEGVVPIDSSVSESIIQFERTGFLFPYGFVLESIFYLAIALLLILYWKKIEDLTLKLLLLPILIISGLLVYFFYSQLILKPLYNYSYIQKLTIEMVSTDAANNTLNLDTRGKKNQYIWKGRNQNYQSFEYNSDDISYLSLRLSNEEEKNSGLSQNPYFASLQRSSDYPLDHIPGLAIVDKNHKRHFILSWKEAPSSSQVFLKEIDAFSEMLGIPLVILDSNYNNPENKIASWKIPLKKWEASRTWSELFIMVFAMGFAVILLYAIVLYPLLFVVAILPKWIVSLALQRPFPREARTYFQEAASTRIFYVGHAVVVAFLIGNFFTERHDPERELSIRLKEQSVDFRIYNPNKEYSPLQNATGLDFWIGVFYGNPFEIWNRLNYLAEEKEVHGSVPLRPITSIRFNTRHSRLDFYSMDSDNRREVLLPENSIDMRGVDPLTVRNILEALRSYQ